MTMVFKQMKLEVIQILNMRRLQAQGITLMPVDTRRYTLVLDDGSTHIFAYMGNRHGTVISTTGTVVELRAVKFVLRDMEIFKCHV